MKINPFEATSAALTKLEKKQVTRHKTKVKNKNTRIYYKCISSLNNNSCLFCLNVLHISLNRITKL